MSADAIKPEMDASIDFPERLAEQASILAKSVSEFTQDAVISVARVTYTSAYFMAYAAVFTAVFVGKSLPRRNPVMRGFEDGGKAASQAMAEQKRARA